MQSLQDFPTDVVSTFVSEESDAPERAAGFLKSIAHRDRLKLLCTLLDGTMTVTAIEARVGASQSAVSQHLARLKAEGLVSSRRDGRQIFYTISDPTVRQLITLLYNRFCATDDKAKGEH